MSRIRSRSAALSNLVLGTKGGRMVALAPILGSAFFFSGFAQGALFYDNFTRATDPGPLTPWQAQTGNWAVTGGHLEADANASPTYDLAYVTNSWTNYAVQCQ